MSLNFCQSCNNLLTYTHTPDRQLMMKCQSCGRPENNIKNVCVYYNKFVQNSYDIKLDADQCYDNTLPYTDEIPCLNTECPSNGFDVFVEDKLQQVIQEFAGDELAGKEEFEKRGGQRSPEIVAEWQQLSNQEKEAYRARSNVLPKIVYFHYNDDKKLAYICCNCETYWKN